MKRPYIFPLFFFAKCNLWSKKAQLKLKIEPEAPARVDVATV